MLFKFKKRLMLLEIKFVNLVGTEFVSSCLNLIRLICSNQKLCHLERSKGTRFASSFAKSKDLLSPAAACSRG
jgi:hypothetical protein